MRNFAADPSHRTDCSGTSLITELSGSVLIVAIVVCLPLFFSSSIAPSVSRWSLFLTPLSDNFVDYIWWGNDLPAAPYTGERFVSLGLGLLFLFSSFFLGAIVLAPFQRILNLTSCERVLFSEALGLVFSSTFLLFVGLLGRANLPIVPLVLTELLLGAAYYGANFLRGTKGKKTICEDSDSPKIKVVGFERVILACQCALAILFASFYLFAATQPIYEYDAVEYHVQSAREIFESGRIAFFPHNAYANMPLGTELFYALGFDMARDVGYVGQDILRIGSLIGKTIITSFIILTALGLFTLSRRLFKTVRSGIWATVIFLSLPGVFEVGVGGLNDCALGFVLLMSLYSVALYLQASANDTVKSRSATFFFPLLIGIFAGFAATVKYTGVVFVVAPIGVLLFVLCVCPNWGVALFSEQDSFIPPNDKSLVSFDSISVRLRRAFFSALLFALAVVFVAGGWFVRNAATTGNPTFPLAYRVFGDSSGGWNDSINARWERAHSSENFDAKALRGALRDSLWGDRSASPFFALTGVFVLALFFAFPLKDARSRFFAIRDLRFLALCSIIIIGYWIGWFCLTHRITRFLLPIAPFSCLLAGRFISRGFEVRSIGAKVILFVSLLTALLYSGLLIDQYGPGRMASLRSLERDPYRFTEASIYFNDRPELFPNNERLLLVGEAKAFMYRVPILYSTCWNDSPLVSIFDGAVERDLSGQVVKITDPDKILAAFHKMNVRYVLVDFAELTRFRSEGNYGFNNPEITGELFALLANSDVLEIWEPSELRGKKTNNSAILFRVSERLAPIATTRE